MSGMESHPMMSSWKSHLNNWKSQKGIIDSQKVRYLKLSTKTNPYNMKAFQKLIPLTLFFFLLIGMKASFSQEAQKTRILFVLDASQSMYARWENQQRMQVATRLLRELVDSLEGADNLELALRIYGHQYSVVPG